MIDDKLYKIIRPLLTFLFKLLFHPKIIGKKNIPNNTKAVLAGNHTNILDPILLLSATKRSIHFLAKDELINGKCQFIFKHMGIIPVNRRQKDHGALENAIKSLQNDQIIGIFPEGTINRTDDIIMPFKYGAVKMAQATNSPLIPFTIKGKYKIFGPSVTLTFGKPYYIKENLSEAKQILETKIINMLKKEGHYGNH